MPEIPTKPPEQSSTIDEKKSSTIFGTFIKSALHKIIKGILYQLLIKSIIFGIPIKLLKTIEMFAEGFTGEVGRISGRGCLFVFTTLPRILLETTIALLDIVFDSIFPD